MVPRTTKTVFLLQKVILKTNLRTWELDGQRVANKTNDEAGDGTTTATILAQTV